MRFLVYSLAILFCATAIAASVLNADSKGQAVDFGSERQLPKIPKPQKKKPANDNESPRPHKKSKKRNASVGLGGGAGDGATWLKGLGNRKRRLSQRKDQDARITAGLNWLDEHQNIAGFWSATAYDTDSTRDAAKHTQNVELVKVGQEDGDTGWSKTSDMGLTGLSLLTFVSAGYDHTQGPYQNTCRKAIKYLRRNQAQDGCFGSQEDGRFVYNHAICTVAMAEIYITTGQALLKPITDKAVDFIIRCQNPGFGWRYGVQPEESDTSVSGWMVKALKIAKMAGIDFETKKSFDDAKSWFDKVTNKTDNETSIGYTEEETSNFRLDDAKEYESNPTLDAIYSFSILAIGKGKPTDDLIAKFESRIVKDENLPNWEHHRIDYYYWHWASLASFQTGGENWGKWEKSVNKVLMDHQRGFHDLDVKAKLTTPETLDEHGSWDAVDAWGTAGGRVYSTAINCLTLCTYQRYKRFQDK